MKINKGLIRDLAHVDSPLGSWRDGKNFVIDNGNIKSEKGFTAHTTLDNTIIGVGTLANIIIIFSIKYTDTTYEYSEIGIIENDIYTSRLKNEELNFNVNYPITCEAKYNYLGQIIVAFTDDYNPPRLINLDDIPTNINDNVNLINLFGSYKVPIYKLNSVSSTTGTLKSGVYYIGLQYALKDKSYSQTSRLSNPIVIVKDSMSKLWNTFGACDGNTLTNKMINMQISNLDTAYTYIRMVVVHKTDSFVSAYVGHDIPITSGIMTIKILDISTYEAIELADVITPDVSYNRVATITSLDSVLYLANLKATPDIKYQKYANNIKIDWVYDTQIALSTVADSYKDAVILFDKKTFVPDEIYAFYIRFTRLDGTKVTNAFHIPGRPLESSDIVSGSATAQTIYSSAKKFHLENTATSNGDGTGKMGAWQNENEYYPPFFYENQKDNDYNGSVDYNGDAIVDGIDLTNSKVRHHKFPSIAYLSSLGIDYKPVIYSGTSSPSGSQSASLLSPTIDPTVVTPETTIFCKFDSMTSTVGGLVYSSYKTVYTNDTGADLLDFSINYNISSYSRVAINLDGLGIMTLVVNIIVKDGATVIRTISRTAKSILGDHIASLNVSNVVDDLVILEGYTIDIEIYVTKDGDSGAFNTVNFSGSTIEMTNAESGAIVAGETYAKILGIKVSNIQIPQYIKDECSHFEILYAKRTTGNMTVIGNGFLAGKAVHGSGDTLFPRHSFYSYDILSQKLDIPITHLSVEWSFINKEPSTTALSLQYPNLTFAIGAGDGTGMYIPTRLEVYRLIKITGSGIVQYNQPNGEFDNDKKSESLYVDYVDEDLYEYNYTPLITKAEYGAVTGIICNACSFKEDVYLSMFNQELATTGRLVSIEFIEADELVTAPTIYGGDVVLSYYGASVYYENQVSYILAPTYNILNSALRYSDDANVLTTMFPNYSFTTSSNVLMTSRSGDLTNFSRTMDDAPGIGGTRWADIIALLTITEVVDFPEIYLLNTTNASVNDLVLGLIFNPSTPFISSFPYRVHRGLVQGSETTRDAWRAFKVSNYYDSENNRGEIYALETDGADLLILHSSTLFVAQHKDSLNMENNIAVALGQSDIFATKPVEIAPDDNGYVGCQSRFAITKSIYGITIVDRQQRKIFIYQNRKIEEISNYGLREFFINNLQYTDYTNGAINVVTLSGQEAVTFGVGSAAITSNTELSSEINSKVDNPFMNKGITCVYDKRYNRFIFTKNHRESVDGEIIEDSFTISYYPLLKAWGFRHTYIPQYYFNGRLNSYAVYDNIIYTLNTGATGRYNLTNLDLAILNYQQRVIDEGGVVEDIDGLNDLLYLTVHPSHIDIVISDGTVLDKQFLSMIWSTIYTDGQNNNKINKLKSFDKIIVYNEDRYSGIIPLTVYEFGTTNNIRLTSGGWKFNQFRDVLLDKTIKILDRNDIEELQINDSVLTPIDWTNKNMFNSPYAIVRLVFNNDDNTAIELLDFQTNFKNVLR